ncbi:hypothetical protein HDU76_004542 [Blyttiomyces sp. JEL0837]|nr:hypothetical protein HDU76_004542 [Blyttiomyces sp. JEL0837]
MLALRLLLTVALATISLGAKDHIFKATKKNPWPYPLSATGAKGTFYDTNTILQASDPGACALPHSFVASDMFVALNHPQFGKSELCGMCINIFHPDSGKSVVAIVADECPECKTGALDLSPTIFHTFASFSTGVLKVNWNEIPCPGSTADNNQQSQPSNLMFTFTPDSSKYWLSVQPSGAGFALTKLEVQNYAASPAYTGWKALVRSTDNHWTISNPGDGPFSFRITMRDGGVAVVGPVKLMEVNAKPVVQMWTPGKSVPVATVPNFVHKAKVLGFGKEESTGANGVLELAGQLFDPADPNIPQGFDFGPVFPHAKNKTSVTTKSKTSTTTTTTTTSAKPTTTAAGTGGSGTINSNQCILKTSVFTAWQNSNAGHHMITITAGSDIRALTSWNLQFTLPGHGSYINSIKPVYDMELVSGTIGSANKDGMGHYVFGFDYKTLVERMKVGDQVAVVEFDAVYPNGAHAADDLLFVEADC